MGEGAHFNSLVRSNPSVQLRSCAPAECCAPALEAQERSLQLQEGATW